MSETMKPYEIRELGLEGVQRELEETEEAYSNLIFRHKTNQLNNPLTLRLNRRKIARLRTILKEHELGILPLAEKGTQLDTKEQASEETHTEERS